MTDFSLMTDIELIEAWIQADTQAKTLKATADAYKAEIVSRKPDGGEIDGHKITRIKGRLNEQKLAQAYPADQYAQLYTTKLVLDMKRVEENFAPALLDTFRNTPSYRVK